MPLDDADGFLKQVSEIDDKIRELEGASE